jgi:Holliday junction DNA helicase RuvB
MEGHNMTNANEVTMRPKFLSQYQGQDSVVASLQIMISAARKRNAPLDHVLITGPGGLGKTTLANCIANEMGTVVKFVTAPNIDSVESFRIILCSMEKGEILFIDEVHALSTQMVETLYTVMEDFYFDGVVKIGNRTFTQRANLDPFTVIAATTNPEKLTPSLRTRFAQQVNLDYYSIEDLTDVVLGMARSMDVAMTEDGAKMLAQCGRGTPRVVINLMRRVRDLSEIRNNIVADESLVADALASLQIDSLGLTAQDRKYLQTVVRFGNAPMGINMLASALREAKQVIEEMIEPYLIERGLILRTAKGRIVTEAGVAHVA